MADNSQAIAQALAEAEQRVQQLRAQLQQAQSSNPVAAKYAAQKQSATMRMANAMGAAAQQGQAFVDQDRMLNQGNGDRTRQLLRMKMQQLANPGMSPMQMDLQRRMPPSVTPGAAAQWQQSNASPEDWNNPWNYTGG